MNDKHSRPEVAPLSVTEWLNSTCHKCDWPYGAHIPECPPGTPPAPAGEEMSRGDWFNDDGIFPPEPSAHRREKTTTNDAQRQGRRWTLHDGRGNAFSDCFPEGFIARAAYRAGMLRAAEIVNEWCECGADGCIPDSIANAIREEAEKE